MPQNNLRGMFSEIANLLEIIMFRIISNVTLLKANKSKLEKKDKS